MDLLSQSGPGVSIRPKREPPVGGFIGLNTAYRTAETPTRENLRTVSNTTKQESDEERSYPFKFDLEFDLDDCREFWGAGERSGLEFADPVSPNKIGLHEFVTTLCDSLASDRGLGPAFEGGVAWVGRGEDSFAPSDPDPSLPLGRPRAVLVYGHRLVQPYPGSKYIKYSTLLCTIAAREPPGNRQDILAALEDAVSFGYIAAGLTIAEFAVPEEYADPDLGLDGPICIPATKVFVHDGRKQSRARATALVRTLPTFAQHAHRIRISSSAHFPNALSAHETLDQLLHEKTVQAEEAEIAAREEQAALYAQREREEQRLQEKARQAEKLQAMREARERYERERVAARAEEVIRSREEAESSREDEQRAAAAAARAERAVQKALERKRREKALELARLDAEAKEAAAEERNERTAEARSRTLLNIQSARDAEERAARLDEWRREAEWLASCEKTRKAGEARRLQGTRAIEWGGSDEAEATRQKDAERRERTERARKLTEAHIARARYEEMRKWEEADWEEERERARWEQEMRERHASNREEGNEALRRAQIEKEKIDAQNEKYRKAREAIANAKLKSEEALRLKLENDAKEEAARVAEEKRLRREQFHKREAARVATMQRAHEATEKELRRVARQEVRRTINRLPLPRSEAEWLDVLRRLAQPSDSDQSPRVDSDELLTFLNGPKHRDYVKWYVKRERASSSCKTLPPWISLGTLEEAAQQYCLEVRLPKLPPEEDQSSPSRARGDREERVPWCPPSGRGLPPKTL